MKVLIAEDDTVTRRILQLGLESLGHECIPTANGNEALEVFCREDRIEVVISDRMMPGMDGIELCRHIRGSQDEHYIYFIFITALGERGDLLEGLKAGADNYLTKPLDQQQLRARLLTASRVTELHGRLYDQKLQLERLNRELWEVSRQDPLTSLGNRLRLREDVDGLIDCADGGGLGYCDIDGFKDYNDYYGHLAGDEVLQRVAESIASGLRQCDRAYRYGGEEFLITLPEQNLQTAAVAVERLRSRIESLDIVHEVRNDEGTLVTTSIVLSELDTRHERPTETMLRKTDEALYEAKRLGKNRVVVSDVRRI